MLRGLFIVIIVGGIALAGVLVVMNRPAPQPPLPPAPDGAPVDAPPAPETPMPATVSVPISALDDPFAAATTEYQEAKTTLELELEKQAAEANPEIIEPVKENLGLIERAVMEVTMALAENPESEPLQKRLLDMYDAQIQLLRKALRLTAAED